MSMPACLPCLATATARPRPRIRKGQQPPTVPAVSSSFTSLNRRSCADKASSNTCAPTERTREEDEEKAGRLELPRAESERKPEPWVTPASTVRKRGNLCGQKLTWAGDWQPIAEEEEDPGER